jgi:glucose/arabinose dehydrogenase
MCIARPGLAIVLPENFVLENVTPGTGFNQPTGFAFLPDGRILVAEKRGVVRVIKDGVKLAQPMWDRQAEVLNQGDRGLLGIAVHPHYPNPPYVYFLYTVDPDSNLVDTNDDAFGRLTRYRTDAANPDVVDTTSRTILFGCSWADGVPSGSSSHAIGDLQWGTDGSLLVSAGDGGHYAVADSGDRDPLMFADGRVDPIEDVGAFRAQYLGSLAGKILRIDPETGAGYPSNPFWDGDPMSRTSRVWGYGHRNPYRFCVRPGTGSTNLADGDPGVLVVGDVGWKLWEEVTVVLRGTNSGWPCYEGLYPQESYVGLHPDHSDCGGIGAGNPGLPRPPAIAWHHQDPAVGKPAGLFGTCVIGGVFHTGTGYPYPWRGGYFFSDFGMDWIKVARMNDDHEPAEIVDFATEAEAPTAFGVEPGTGNIYYTAYMTGRLYRIRYTGTLDVAGGGAPLRIAQARPNPATRAVAFELDLPRESELSLRVLDISGRLVWQSQPVRRLPGPTALHWNCETADGGVARPGVYFGIVNVNDQAYTRTVILRR